MESSGLVERLVCPDDRSPLALAEAGLLHMLNEAVAQRTLKNRAGRLVVHRLDGALVRRDGTLAYPIVDGIPRLLVDEAIPLSQFDEA